jgi:hypothetical protein
MRDTHHDFFRFLPESSHERSTYFPVFKLFVLDLAYLIRQKKEIMEVVVSCGLYDFVTRIQRY